MRSSSGDRVGGDAATIAVPLEFGARLKLRLRGSCKANTSRAMSLSIFSVNELIHSRGCSMRGGISGASGDLERRSRGFADTEVDPRGAVGSYAKDEGIAGTGGGTNGGNLPSIGVPGIDSIPFEV